MEGFKSHDKNKDLERYLPMEVFLKHERENNDNFSKLNRKLDDSKREGEERHDEIIGRLNGFEKNFQPVFAAFDLKQKLGEVGIKAIVRWTKILSFVLIVSTLIMGGWKILVYLISEVINNIKK